MTDVEELRLHDLTPAAARDLLSRGAPVALLVNPVEYHGPHLSPHNDGLISAGLVRDLHCALSVKHPDWPLIWAAELAVGVGPIPGPGSQPVPFGAVCRAVVESCRSLATLGARRVVLMTFHGSPRHNLALQRGVDLLERCGVRVVAPVAVILRDQLHLDPAILSAVYDTLGHGELRRQMQAEAAMDIHAGFLETSLSLHYAPETVSGHEGMADCPRYSPDPRVKSLAVLARRLGSVERAAELDFIAGAAAWLDLRPFPGYTSRPSLASAEAGAALARLFIERYGPLVEEVFAGRARSPRAVMGWMDPAGRSISAIMSRSRRRST